MTGGIGESAEVLDTLDERHLAEWASGIRANIRGLIEVLDDLEQYGGLEGALAMLEEVKRAGEGGHRPSN